MKYFRGALLQHQISTQGYGICRKQQSNKHRKWKIREYQRLRCEVRFEENKLLLLLRVCMYALLYGSHLRSHAEGVNRRHRGVMCSAFVGRAVRCACGSITHSRAQGTMLLILLLRSNKRSTEEQLQQRQSTKHTALSSILHLHPASPRTYGDIPLSVFSAASRRHGSAAWAVRW